MAAEPGAWSDLGNGLRLRRSRLFQMNSVVLEDSGHVSLVDPGILPSELDDLAAQTSTAREVTIVFTHGDWDHVLGRPWWPKATTVGHDSIAMELRRNRDAIREAASRVAAQAGEKYTQPFEPFRPDEAVSGLRATRLGSRHAVYRDAFGHSASMLSLHFPELRLLIAGDMLSDIELPILSEPRATALAEYRRTLEALLPLAEHGAIDTLIPGHGSEAQGDEVYERVRRDLDYLVALDRVATRAVREAIDDVNDVARLEAFDLSPWGQDPSVNLDETHRDNLELAVAAAARQPRRHG